MKPINLITLSKFHSSVFRGRLLSGPVKEALPEPTHRESSFRVWASERKVLSYTFKVDIVYKGRIKRERGGWTAQKRRKGKTYSPFRVKVFTDPYTCTARLSSRTSYVVGGYIDEGKMFISSCNFVRPWYTLTKSQKYGFQFVYGDNCQCHSSACSSLDPQGELLDKYCSEKHLYCGRQGLSCQWKHVTRSFIPYNKCVFMNMYGFYFRNLALALNDP